jgi:glycosyltransferase involved in cell wall biosynthesis
VRSRYAADVRYTRENRPGLAVAHNHGLRFVDSPVVAFTDDDVVVDRWWLTSVAAAFHANPGAAAVTGFIAPDELETPTQVLLERHGAFGKGALRRVYDLRENRPADTLFPFTAGQLGSGANMAFRTDALRDVGGFDPSLGTGTPAKGGDDLAALFSMVAAGHQVIYEPGAMVRHRHHHEPAALAKQSFGYGVGLGAFLTGAALAHPRLVLDTARFVPHGVRYAFSGSSARNKGRFDGWPKGLAWRERAGLALGPLAYARSRLATRRWAG